MHADLRYGRVVCSNHSRFVQWLIPLQLPLERKCARCKWIEKNGPQLAHGLAHHFSVAFSHTCAIWTDVHAHVQAWRASESTHTPHVGRKVRASGIECCCACPRMRTRGSTQRVNAALASDSLVCICQWALPSVSLRSERRRVVLRATITSSESNKYRQPTDVATQHHDNQHMCFTLLRRVLSLI
jgi:hypothetical protein